MSSSNFATPPLKLILGAIAIVVMLHILTAVALAMVKTSVPVIKPPKISPPIEIKIIEPLPIKIEQLKTEQIKTEQIKREPIDEPIKQTVTNLQEKSKSLAASKTKVQEESKPKNKAQSVNDKEPITKKEPIVDKSKPFKITQDNDQHFKNIENERLRVEAQKQRLLTAQVKAEAELLAKQQTQELANKQAEANRLAQEARAKEAADNKAAQDKADREKADKQRADKEKSDKAAADKRAAEALAAKKEKDKQAELAASNDPVDFTSAEANWANRPDFSFSDKLKSESRAMAGDVFAGTLAFSVDKQGNIKKATISKSSGNTVIDRAAVLQAKRAKFKPFIRNGIARTGSVILPFVYNVP